MKLTEILDTLKDLDQQILELKRQYAEYQKKKNDLELKIKEYELDIKYDVYVKNKIEDNVKLTNQESRKVYIEKRLLSDSVYRELNNELKHVNEALSNIDLEIEQLIILNTHFINLLNFNLYDDEEEI